MKKTILTLVALFVASISFAQQGMNYKALITNNGNAMTNQSVTIKFTVLQNGTTAVYQETQSVTTDANGIVSLQIGEGTPVSGTFSTIDFSNNQSLKVEINTGSGFADFGTNALQYVPTAKYADKAGSVDFSNITNVPTGLADGDDVNDADHNASNELQTISKNASNVVTLSNGGGSFTDADTHLTDTQITAMGYIKSANDADNDPTNEIELPATASNGQVLTWNGTAWVAQNAGTGGAQALNDLSDAKRAGTAYYIGQNAGNAVSNSSRYNVGIGHEALKNSTNADYTTAIGYKALYSNTTGNYNTAIGSKALYYNTTGNSNIANGSSALYANTTGSSNIANGSFALYANTTGSSNIAIGYYALHDNTTINDLVAIGYKALENNGTGASGSLEAHFNTAVGTEALRANTIGYRNTANGYKALTANTTGNYNTANGYKALTANTTGEDNTANGSYALYNNTTGEDNTANGTEALYNNTTGYENTALGDYAFLDGTDYHNSTAIGQSAPISSSNHVRLGNARVTWIGGHSAWHNTSDGRFKRNVQETVPGLAFITKLRPVNYTWDLNALEKFRNVPHKDDKHKAELDKERAEQERVLHTGFIAQEVEQAAKDVNFKFDGVHHPENEKDTYSVAYAEFVVPLVKAVQEQQEQIIELQKQNKELLERINKIEAQNK